jgi:hypothetical protein
MNLNILLFIAINILLFFSLLFIAFVVRNIKLKENNKNTETLFQYLNGGTFPSIKNIGLGLIFGIIFGFLDNLGLWIGIINLQKYMPGDLKMKAAIGNTYSDLLGATVGTFISTIFQDIFNYRVEREAIWINSIGIFIGCILGIGVGKML